MAQKTSSTTKRKKYHLFIQQKSHCNHKIVFSFLLLCCRIHNIFLTNNWISFQIKKKKTTKRKMLLLLKEKNIPFWLNAATSTYQTGERTENELCKIIICNFVAAVLISFLSKSHTYGISESKKAKREIS